LRTHRKTKDKEGWRVAIKSLAVTFGIGQWGRKPKGKLRGASESKESKPGSKRFLLEIAFKKVRRKKKPEKSPETCNKKRVKFLNEKNNRVEI